jgi:hypothetical protein
MSEQVEIEARARQMLAEAAEEAERSFLDGLRDRNARKIFMRAKKGVKVERLFQTGIGAAFAERITEEIAAACDVWFDAASTDKDIAIARLRAMAAIASLHVFEGIVGDGKDAEAQLKLIDHEIGEQE